jgi:hypothetical protein
MKGKKKTNWDAQVDVERLNDAYHFILQGFTSSFKDTYFRGKTEFRDFLYEKMGCSLLESEILIDALEKEGKIEFRRFRKGMRFGTWIIHKSSMRVNC